ncbi:MAG: heparan-alpha-glucosaminide N-acetyltransferase domain-containing protein [Victivallaceae bacterium]|nr:heparan-alpha-glucosaminide N-acetyltransferase domain-containing protein [Victivallaceae bacterium]
MTTGCTGINGGAPRQPAVSAVGTGRRMELDILKVIAIFEMIAMHLQEIVFSFNYNDRAFVQNSWWILFLGNATYLTGTFGFMFSMGCTIPFSRRNDPAANIRRGIGLLAAWLSVNVLRTMSFSLLRHAMQGVPFRDSLMFVVANDVLCFTGLFFLLYGGLQKANLSRRTIRRVIEALFVIAQLLGDCGRFLPRWAYPLLGGIVDIVGFSSFPLLNWGIIVMVGVEWGTFLLGGEDKTKTYGVLTELGAAATIPMLVYMQSRGMLEPEVMLKTIADPLRMHHANIISVSCAAAAVALQIGLFYFLAQALPECINRWISAVAGKILHIYVAHWIILPWLGFLPWLRSGRAGIGKVALVTLALYATSYVCATIYAKARSNLRRQKKA